MAGFINKLRRENDILSKKCVDITVATRSHAFLRGGVLKFLFEKRLNKKGRRWFGNTTGCDYNGVMLEISRFKKY